MITQRSFEDVKAEYAFIATLPPKLQELISSEIPPGADIVDAFSVTIGGVPGCILIFENQLSAFWLSKLFFLKFPTLQEFNFSQLNTVNPEGSNRLYLHCSANPEVMNEDYEEGTFVFSTESERDAALSAINAKAIRLR